MKTVPSGAPELGGRPLALPLRGADGPRREDLRWASVGAAVPAVVPALSFRGSPASTVRQASLQEPWLNVGGDLGHESPRGPGSCLPFAPPDLPDSPEGPAAEGTARAVPGRARNGGIAGGNRPADRAARRKALEGRLRDAQCRAAAEVALPLAHGRCCLAGLLLVEVLRLSAWFQGTVPGWSVFGMHFLTTASDTACLVCTAPLYAIGVNGQCVQLGCLGPMLTLVFAMCLVDLSAFGAYLVVATPRPLSPDGRSFVDALEACAGVWEFALVASVACQVALCSCSWRVYRELRVVGLYPPGSDPANIGERREISVLEVMCEAEDVELLADCELTCDNGQAQSSTPRGRGPTPVQPPPAPTAAAVASAEQWPDAL